MVALYGSNHEANMRDGRQKSVDMHKDRSEALAKFKPRDQVTVNGDMQGAVDWIDRKRGVVWVTIRGRASQSFHPDALGPAAEK